MSARIFTSVIAILLASQMAASDGIQFNNEKLLFSSTRPCYREVTRYSSSMRISPDGTKLIYLDVEPNKQETGATSQPSSFLYVPRMMNLTSGIETKIPVPPSNMALAYEGAFSGWAFSPDGKSLALGAGIDKNNAGQFEPWKEPMQPAIYDIASGRLQRLGLTSTTVGARYDRSGKNLLIIAETMERVKGYKFVITPIETFKEKELPVRGFLMALCPTSDVAVLALPQQSSPMEKLVLYDLKQEKELRQLPNDAMPSGLAFYPSFWTLDGKYLCYADVPGGGVYPTKERMVTRILVAGDGYKQAPPVGDAEPLGVGPTTSTVMLGFRDLEAMRAGKQPWDKQHLIIHDCATEKSYEYGRDQIRMLAAQGNRVIYVQKDDAGKEKGVYAAEIMFDAATAKPYEPKPAPKVDEERSATRPAWLRS